VTPSSAAAAEIFQGADLAAPTNKAVPARWRGRLWLGLAALDHLATGKRVLAIGADGVAALAAAD
jgi:hypothetical protein